MSDNTVITVAPRRRAKRDYPNKAQVYQWDDWFARGGIRARKGVDYHCSTASFMQQARNAARKKFKLSIREEEGEDGEEVLIKATRINPEAEQQKKEERQRIKRERIELQGKALLLRQQRRELREKAREELRIQKRLEASLSIEQPGEDSPGSSQTAPKKPKVRRQGDLLSSVLSDPE